MTVKELRAALADFPDEAMVASPNIGSLVAMNLQTTIPENGHEAEIPPGIIWMHFGRKP